MKLVAKAAPSWRGVSKKYILPRVLVVNKLAIRIINAKEEGSVWDVNYT
jgi:hypothetical protein